MLADSTSELQRIYEFVIADPNFAPYGKPVVTPPVDMQKFVVRMYEYYTQERSCCKRMPGGTDAE